MTASIQFHWSILLSQLPYNRFFMRVHVYYLCVFCGSRSCRIRHKSMQTAHAQAHPDGSASYYFSRVLPTAEDTGIGEVATREANKAVTEELRCSEADQTKQTCKRKPYSVSSGKQRAQIGKCAAENGNAAAVKRFKDDYKLLTTSM